MLKKVVLYILNHLFASVLALIGSTIATVYGSILVYDIIASRQPTPTATIASISPTPIQLGTPLRTAQVPIPIPTAPVPVETELTPTITPLPLYLPTITSEEVYTPAYPTDTPAPTQVPPTDTPYPTPTFSPTATPSPTPRPPTNTSTPTSTRVPLPTRTSLVSDLIQLDMDNAFGVDNWVCFPDREDRVGIRSLPRNVQVEEPVNYIETEILRIDASNDYLLQQWPPGPAMAYLQKPLPYDECPTRQKDALAEWRSQEAENDQSIKRLITSKLDRKRWDCNALILFGNEAINVYDSPYMANLSFPFTALSHLDNNRLYGVGDEIPAGHATIWLTPAGYRAICP